MCQKIVFFIRLGTNQSLSIPKPPKRATPKSKITEENGDSRYTAIVLNDPNTIDHDDNVISENEGYYDGSSNFDQDQDGFYSLVSSTDDCDDNNPNSYLGSSNDADEDGFEAESIGLLYIIVN